MNATTQSLSTDTALEVLAAHRRRQVIQYLIDSDGTATIDQLVAATGTTTGSATAPDATQERRALDLRHVHLPKLQDAGLVEYDARTETIQYHPSDLLEEFLQVCSSN